MSLLHHNPRDTDRGAVVSPLDDPLFPFVRQCPPAADLAAARDALGIIAGIIDSTLGLVR